MKSFLTYLTEGKNTHLTHLEDSILIDGSEGVKRAVAFLSALVDMLSGKITEEEFITEATKITLKWDGAPAVVAGIDPITKKFFVGTKAAFSKGQPKLNFTNRDIDKYHGGQGDLPDKLKASLKYLPSIWKKGVFQGDMMFIRNQLKKASIGGVDHITFKPNNITYAVPLKSELGKQISSAQFGIVWHTRYTGKSVPEMSSSFNVSRKDFKKHRSVWFDDAEFRDAQTALFTDAEEKAARQYLKNASKLSGQVGRNIDHILKWNKGIINKLIQYNNQQVRVGNNVPKPEPYFDDFVDWYIEEKRKTLKTFDAAKEKALRQDLMSRREAFVDVLHFYKLLIEAKQIVIDRLNRVKAMKTFLETPNGFEVVGHEGFVAIDKTGSSIKLVNRLEFTKNLFTTEKGWSK